MTDVHVIDELLTRLVNDGIVQRWSKTYSGTLPSAVITPIKGAPLPRATEPATVTLRQSGVSQPNGMDAWLEETAIEVIVRARSAPAGRLLHRVIRGVIHPRGAFPAQTGWQLTSNLLVERSYIWRREQTIPPANNQTEGQRDLVTYDTTESYMFAVRRALLST